MYITKKTLALRYPINNFTKILYFYNITFDCSLMCTADTVLPRLYYIIIIERSTVDGN